MEFLGQSSLGMLFTWDTVKILKIWTKFAVITLKFEQGSFTMK